MAIVTLQDAFEEAALRAMIEAVCEAVADEGVEIHQWLRDEHARAPQPMRQGGSNGLAHR